MNPKRLEARNKATAQSRTKASPAFLKALAKEIQKEAARFSKQETSPEPYRAAGDRLVDDALALVP